MKSAKKFLAATLAVMHLLTYSAPAQQVINVTEGTTTNVDSIQVNTGEQLTINVVNQLGEVCPSCRGILETNNLLNNGAIDIWGILAIIAPTIINNGVITVQGDLLLSNLGINKEQFFAGIAELSKDPSLANGYILNNGEIKNLTQGLLVMVAANGGIHNFGTISANGGAVALVAGDSASFPLTRDGVLNISLEGVTGVKGQVFDKDGNLVDTKGLVTNAGVLQANGGAVVLQAAGAEALYDSIINHTGIIEAKSVAQENGKIILKSETGNIRVTDATIDASGLNAGEKGGSVEILTKGNVIVDGTTVIDASGTNGGGEVLIGGDAHGAGSLNAANVGIGSDVKIKADAITGGNGGKIIVWSDGTTLAYGDFSAKGGAQSGNGGFIETSGKEFLDVDGIGIDASAAHGANGLWLLDPRNVTISTSNTSGGNAVPGGSTPWNFVPTSNSAIVKVSDITGKLNGGTDVTITTGTTSGSPAQNGDITLANTISAAVAGDGNATLSLIAAGSIIMNAAVTATSGILNVILTAANGVTLSNSSADISTNGGNLTINADSDANGSGIFSQSGTGSGDSNINAAGGDISITANDFVTDNGAFMNAGSGTIFLKTSVANKTFGLGNTDQDFDVSDAEADNMTADTLEIGNSAANDIVARSFSPAHVSTLVLRTGDDVRSGGSGTDVSVANLAIYASDTVDIETNINNLAINAGGAVTINDSGSFAVGTVDGLSGVTTTNDNITLSADADLTLAADVNAGTADVDLTSTNNSINQTGGSVTANDLIVDAENSVTLNQVANKFDTVNVNAKDAVDIKMSDRSVQIKDIKTRGDDVNFTHSGTGNVTVTGTVSTGSTTGSDLLDIFFGVQGGNISLTSGNLLTIASTAILTTKAGSNGNFSAGAATVEAGSTVTVGNGDITLSGGALVLDTIINTPIIGAGAVLLTALRDVIVSSTVTGPAATDMTITADSDNDGVGGAWLKSGTDVNSDAKLTITGSAIFDAGANGESIRIDSGATVDAKGDIVLQKSTVAPAGADIVIDGVVTTTGVGAKITVDSKGRVDTSNDGAANLIGDNIEFKSVEGIDVEVDADNLNYNNSTSGNIAVEDMAGGLTLTGATNSGSGSATILTHSPLTIAANLIQAGTINLTAGEAAGAGDDLTVNNGITVQSTAGDVNLHAGDNVVLNTTSVVQSNTGAVNVTAGFLDTDNAGNISLAGTLSAATNLVLSALKGTITQTAGSVAATDLTLTSQGNASLNQSANSVSTLTATTTAGDVTYQDASGLDLKASSIVGNLNLTTGGNLTDSANQSVTGTTSLTAGVNSITLDNANDFGGTVTVNSANDVTLKDVNNLTVADMTIGGALSLTADSDNNTVGSTLTTGIISATSVSLSGGTDNDDIITMNGTATSTTGGVIVDHAATLNVNADITSATSLTFQNTATVNLSGDTDLTANNGALSVGTGVTAINLTGGAATTNIFTEHGDAATTLAPITASSNANATVNGDGDVTLGNVNLGTGNLTVNVDNDDDGAMTGTFNNLTAKDLTISGHNLTSGGENLTFNGIINMSGDLNVGGLGILTYNSDVTAKSITIHDISNRVQLGGNVDLTATNGILSVVTNVAMILLAGADGTVNIFDGNGDAAVNLGAISATSNPNLTINSEAGINLTSANIGTGTLTLAVDNDSDSVSTGSFGAVTAGTINAGGTSDDNLDFNAAVVANMAGVTISNANNVDFDSTINTATDLTQTAGSGTTTFSGAATVGGNANVTTGSIAFNGGSINAGVNSVALTAQTGNIASNSAANDVTASNLSASAVTGIDLDTTVTTLTNASTSGTGAIRIDNTGALAVTSATTNDGAITINATGGNLDVTTATAGGGEDINLGTITSGNVNVGNVTAAGDNIVINSAGAIEELGSDVDADLTANDLELTAVNGIGAADTIETDAVTLLNANVSGTGAINLSDIAGGLAVTSATTTDGAITINATGGNLDATTVTAGGTSRDVTLSTTTSGNVNVGNVTAAGDNIAVTSAGAIEELGTDADADLTSLFMFLTSVTGIGAAGQLEIDATTLINASVSGNGAINVSDTTGGLSVLSATTNDGAITINATGGNLDAATVTAGGTSRDVTLSTTTSGNVNVGNVTAAGDNIAVTSAGAIEELVADLDADLTSSTMNLTSAMGVGAAGTIEINATTLTNASVSGTGIIDLNDTAGGLAVTSATTNNGNITINATSGNLVATTVTAGTSGAGAGNGNVTLTTTTSGNITLGTITALSDTATITSAGTIGEIASDDAGVQSVDVSAGTINLTTAGGDIGAPAGYLDIEPTTLWNATSNGGGIYISCVGLCPMGQIDAGTGTFYYAGNITDGNDTVRGFFDDTIAPPAWKAIDSATAADWNIRAGGVHLDAANVGAGFIGTSTNWIEMRLAGAGAALGKITAAAGTGGIHVSNDDIAAHPGLQIGGVTAVPAPNNLADGLVSTGGIEIYSFSPLVVAANVIDNSANSIDLVAAGNLAADDLTVNTGVTINQQGTGAVRMFSGDDINLNGTALVQSTTGTISANAGEDFTDLTINQNGTNGGSIVMANNSALRSQDGNINLTANNHLRISEVNANSNSDATLGDVNLNADANSNGVGRIEDRNGVNQLNVTGNNVTMNAGSGVGVDNANVIDAIETSINKLTLTNTTSGHVAVTEVNAGGALDIVSADQRADLGVNSTMTIQTNDGNLTVLAAPAGSGVQTRSGELTLIANGGGANDDLIVNNTVISTTGKINLDSTSRDVAFSAAGDVTATGGAEIEVNATRNITMSDGTVLNANGGGTQGGIDLDAGNDISLGSVQTTSALSKDVSNNAFDAVQIDAGGAVIDGGDTDNDIIANSGQTTINAVNGIGSADQLDVQLQSLRATNTTANDIRVREMNAGGDLNLVGINQLATNGDLNIRTQNGSLTVLAAVTLLSGFAGGVAAVDGVTRLFAQDNDASGADHLNINNTVKSADGKINLDSENDVIASAQGDVTSGDVARKAGATGAEIEVDALGSITMADGTVFNANAGGPQGGIDMDAQNGNITLGSVQTSSNANNAVVIVSQNGQIIDGGITDTDIITGATGASHLVAKTGIGSADGLETQIGQLAARTESGNIQIFNQGDMTITSLTDNDNSNQTSNNGGTTGGVQITDPTNLNTGANFIFVTNNGNLTVNNDVSNLDGGDVSLYSFGNVGAGNMNINANVESIGANGNMRVVSGGDMNMAAGTNVKTQGNGVASGTGLVAVAAGYDVSGKTRNPDMTVNPIYSADSLGLNSGFLASSSTDGAGSLLDTLKDASANLTMAETARISSEGGNIIADAQNNLIVGRVDADGNAGANGITDGVRGNIYGFARNGSILDAEGPGEVGNLDFVAKSLNLLAAGTIGTGANRIEGDAPFLNTFSVGSQFFNMIGNTQVELLSNAGNISLSATGDIILGHASAPSGEVHLKAGKDISSLGGDGVRVTASNLIELIAGGIVGTTSNPIHTNLLATPAQLNLSAGGQDPSNGVSIAVFSNVSNAAVNMLNTPSGLVLFNNLPIAGASLPGLIGSQAALYYKPFVRGLRQYSDIDGNYAADFPGVNSIENLSFSPDISVDTGALDQIPVRGLTTAPRVVPIPKPAVPTPVQPSQVVEAPKAPEAPVLAKEPTPPAVVSIPANATPSAESKTNEGVPQTPTASN